MKRRSFLQALLVAPAAVPVAAKQAAAKMGLVAVTDVAASQFIGGDSVCGPDRGNDDWAKRALKELMSKDKTQERWDQTIHQARVLDADLASLKSMSPSVAYGIQRERTYHRLTDNERRWLQRCIREQAERQMGL